MLGLLKANQVARNLGRKTGVIYNSRVDFNYRDSGSYLRKDILSNIYLLDCFDYSNLPVLQQTYSGQSIQDSFALGFDQRIADILGIIVFPSAGYSYYYYGILADTAIADSLTVTAGIDFNINLVPAHDQGCIRCYSTVRVDDFLTREPVVDSAIRQPTINAFYYLKP